MRRITVAACASLLLLASCGGDDGGSTTDSGPSDTTTDTTTDATDATTDATTGNTEPASTGGDFCSTMETLNDEMDALDDGDMPIGDPDAMRTMFTSMVTSIEAASVEAPEELADEFEVLNSAYSTLLSKLEAVDFDFVQVLADEELSAVMESAELEAAQDSVSAYVLAECGIDLDDTIAPDDTAPTDTAVDTSLDIPLDGTEIEQATAVYMQIFGLDESRATCLAENTMTMSAAEREDVSQLMGVFADCGITMEDIAGAMQS